MDLAAGSSQRYSGGTTLGRAVWVADLGGGQTVRAGLFTGSELTSGSGVQFSQWAANGFTSAGFGHGTSNRYSGLNDRGRAAWAFDAQTGQTHRIGLFSGAEFTSSTGVQISDGRQITNAGWIWGESTRYNSAVTSQGLAAWLAHAETGATTRIGFFTGSEFTSTNGEQFSWARFMNSTGLVTGDSQRYAGTTTNGFAAWMANPHTGVSTRLGFFGTQEFQSDTLREQSFFDFQYANGLVLGHSSVYNGLEVAFGGAAWMAHNSDGITHRLGLTDALHTRSDGIRNSEIRGHNEEGFIWGRSTRYDGTSGFRGFTAWIWSPLDEAQFSFSFSSRPSDNFAFSRIDQVFPTGLVVGTYTLFDENSVDQGDHLFLWAPGTEAITLNEAVPQGLDAAGWETFLQSRFLYDGNRLVLSGIPNSGPTASRGVGVFELAIVPEPSAGLLLLVGAGAIFSLRRRTVS